MPATATRMQGYLLIETLIFVTASLIHAEVLLSGHDDPAASLAESLLALVLLGGLAIGVIRPSATRDAALVTQTIATIGTCVGLFLTLAVGPRTPFDIGIHAVMLLALAIGLTMSARMPDAVQW